MRARTKIATLLLAWLVLVPLAVLVPSAPAGAGFAPEQDNYLLRNEVPDVEFGTRLSGGVSSSARLNRSAALLPTDPMLPVPEFEITPNEDLNQLINLDSFLRITDGFERKEWCICLWLFTLYFQATPLRSLFEFRETDTGKRDKETCWGPGAPWFFGLTDASYFPFCGREWEHSSDVTGEVEAKARVEHFVLVTGTWNFFYFAQSRASEKKMLDVGEVHYIGQSLTAPVFSSPTGGSGGSGGSSSGWCSKWGISFVCWVGGEAKELLLKAIYAVAPILKEVADFFVGCADAVVDAAGGLVAILEELKELATDPSKFVDEKLGEFRELIAALKEDPQGFIDEVLAGVLQLDKLNEDGRAAWLGSMICTLAIDYFTGKLAASVLVKARRWLRDRKNNSNNPNDPDRPPDPDCLTSSFPGDTLVLLGDGRHERIDAIRPGDWVISHNLDTSVWEPQLVVDQWSHLDRGPPATIELADQSTVTATADHEFWVVNTGEWTELQWVKPGDELLTPAGPTTAAAVTVGPRHPWTVWELTVENNHNFTVVAGDAAVLVHNYNCQPNPKQLGDRSQQTVDRLKADGLDVTPEEVAQAWKNYVKDNPDADFDTWQGQYENIRRNNHLGNAHEAAILDKYPGDLGKNGRTFPDPDGGADFKPDAVLSTDPPHFVEVKDYQNTVLYPGSNAGKQLKYITEHAIENPTNPGTFDLHITDPDNISSGMKDLISDAEAAGVTVRINPELP